MQANQLNKLKRERVCSLASLKSVEQELCDQLCTTPCYIPTGTIPSEEQLEQLKVCSFKCTDWIDHRCNISFCLETLQNYVVRSFENNENHMLWR